MVVSALLENSSYTSVVVVTRRPLSYSDTPQFARIQQRVVDFDTLEASREAFAGVDAAFCCLGTTRGQAGAAGFVKVTYYSAELRTVLTKYCRLQVDHDYVLSAARLLKEAGTQELHLLTSQGSNPGSWLLYPSTKGKVGCY